MKETNSKASSRARLTTNDDGWQLRLYGIVGDEWDGFTDDSVADLLEEVDGSGAIRLNSPGGYVYQGMAIYNLLKEKGVDLVKIDGAAYSMASIIAMAGARIEMGRGSLMMIHNPWNIAMGDSHDMRKQADVLDKMKEAGIDIYQARTGLERDLITEMMDEETWLTAEEAVEWGFADAVTEDESDPAAVDLSILKDARNMPEHLQQALQRQDSASRRPQAAARVASTSTQEETAMKHKTRTPSAASAPADPNSAPPDLEQERQIAVAEERQRVKAIRTMVAEANIATDFAEKMIDDGTTEAEAKAAVDRLAGYLASHGPEINNRHRVECTRDEGDTLRSGAAKALLNRFKPAAHKIEGDDPARQFANMSLMEMARRFVDASGKNTGHMSRVEIAKAALHSTSDFPLVLENVVGKSLRDAYELSPRTFAGLGVRETLPDFKEVSRVRLGSGPSLQKVQEGGEYTYGELDEGGEKYRVFKYGKVLALTWESIINDDLNAFTRVPGMLGAAGGQIESDIFWAELTGNPALSDGTTLFHADRNNLAGSGAAISIDSLSGGRSAMRKQKDGDFFLNLQPQFLVVPTAIETQAEQFVSQNMLADQAGSINPFANRLQVVSEPRLDANSATAWYLWASPSVIDTIAFAYLQGEEGPQIETDQGFDVDGMKIKVRHVFGAKAIDPRGLYKNPGA